VGKRGCIKEQRGQGTDIKMGCCANAALGWINEVCGVFGMKNARARNVLRHLMQRK